MCGEFIVRVCVSPVVGRSAQRSGSSPAPDGGYCSEWLQRGPDESPPASASHLLLAPPESVTRPGNAERQTHREKEIM